MDTFVLGAQATEVRSELLKERKRRFELEAKVRILEQQLAQLSTTRNSATQIEAKQTTTTTEANLDDAMLPTASSPATGTSSPSSAPIASPIPSTTEPTPGNENGISKSEFFDLDAERLWINSVRLPGALNRPRSFSLQRESPQASEVGSLLGEDASVGSETASVGDVDFVLVPAGSQFGPRVSRATRELSNSGSVQIGGSPTMNGSVFGGDSKLSAFGSSWSLQDYNKRRFDDAALRVSQLRIELADYQQVLSETSVELSRVKTFSSFVSSELDSANISLSLLRDQVRDKNARILQLMSENGAVGALKAQLEDETREKLKMAVDHSVLRRKYDALAENEEMLKRQVKTLQDSLQQKEVEVGQKDLMMQKMAEKLMQLKLQLQAIVPHLCKFSVSTVVRFGKPLVVSIGVLKPNAERTRELEIVTSGKRATHPSSFVVSIAPSAKENDRFTVTYKNGNSDVFESTRRLEIVKALNDALFSNAADQDENTVTIVPTSPTNQNNVAAPKATSTVEQDSEQ